MISTLNFKNCVGSLVPSFYADLLLPNEQERGRHDRRAHVNAADRDVTTSPTDRPQPSAHRVRHATRRHARSRPSRRSSSSSAESGQTQ